MLGRIYTCREIFIKNISKINNTFLFANEIFSLQIIRIFLMEKVNNFVNILFVLVNKNLYNLKLIVTIFPLTWQNIFQNKWSTAVCSDLPPPPSSHKNHFTHPKNVNKTTPDPPIKIHFIIKCSF